MKNFYFIFQFCSLIQLVAVAQNYTAFPENTAVWDIYHRPSPYDQYNGIDHYHRYKMQGDTLINSLSYNKIYRSDYAVSSPYPSLGTYNYQFGIRQDSVMKRVYAIFPSDNIDTLLYDFNLQVGDTLKNSYISLPSWYGPGPQTVTSIDSISFHGNYNKFYKRYHLSAGSGATLIEGIGNANGLIEETHGFFEAGLELRNFCNSAHSDCTVSFTLRIDVKNANNSSIIISPNPFTSETQINFSNEYNGTVKITDVLGREVEAINFTGKKLKIQRGEMKAGIYFVQMVDENNNSSIKIVIQ
ncbi:MAG: T9SS type A sorting domain-containing protein [Bacteroidota bacterium]